jgi:cytochrome c oxidase cbb3-type subunit 3
MTEILDKPKFQDNDHTDRNFDGIEEKNNPMPRWWIWLFYVSIAFSVCYLAWYHLPWFPSVSLEDEYRLAKGEKLESQKAQAAALGSDDAFDLSAARSDVSLVAAGKSLFEANCASCHGAKGGGVVGPNLTDDHWIYGSTFAAVVKSIGEGAAAKGMPAWAPILGAEKVRQLAVYIATLRGSTPENPKAPQGEAGVFK